MGRLYKRGDVSGVDWELRDRHVSAIADILNDDKEEHEIAETLYYSWREKLLEGGREALAGKAERQGERELRKRIGQLERALGRKTYELEIAGEALRGWE